LLVPAHSFALRSSPKKAGHCDHLPNSSAGAQADSKEARAEIQAYAAIRDLLLNDAEVTTTTESLRRATIANEFVENCLQPPRSPYQAQHLESRQAARELERCCVAKMRIATLQQKLSPQQLGARFGV